MIVLWRYIGEPGRLHFQIALFLSAVAGASGVVLLGLSGWFLTSAALAGVSGLGLMFNHLNPSAGVRLAAFLRVGSRYTEQLVGHDATLHLSARLRPQIFEKGAYSGRGISPMASGELSALIDNIEDSERGFLRVLSPAVAVLASICVALGFAFATDFAVGIISLIAFTIFGVGVPLYASRMSDALAKSIAVQSMTAREDISRVVENAEELDVIGGLNGRVQQCQETLEELQNRQDAAKKPYRGLGALMSFAGGLLAVFVLFKDTDQSNIAMSVGSALALLAAFDACAAMIKVFDAASQANIAGQRILRRLKAEPVIVEPKIEEAKTPLSLFPIELIDVKTQAECHAEVVGPISFSIEAGDYIQLVGKSGAGKTTLGECLMKLQPVLDGQMSYAGCDHAQLRKAYILSKIAIAPQFPIFMIGSLREQFAFAKPDVSDEEIWQALVVANVDQVVRHSQSGLDTFFSETETGFSGGEMRRIGLARALVNQPDVLILDEPFAGLELDLVERLTLSLFQWRRVGTRAILVLQHMSRSGVILDIDPEQQKIIAI